MSIPQSIKQQPMLLALTSLYSVIFLFSAFEPVSRAVWFAEIIPALLILCWHFLHGDTLSVQQNCLGIHVYLAISSYYWR